MFYSDYESKKSDSAINVKGLTGMRNKHDERLPYKEDIVRSVFRGLRPSDADKGKTACPTLSFRSTNLCLFVWNAGKVVRHGSQIRSGL
jgi:hypothetical protein